MPNCLLEEAADFNKLYEFVEKMDSEIDGSFLSYFVDLTNTVKEMAKKVYDFHLQNKDKFTMPKELSDSIEWLNRQISLIRADGKYKMALDVYQIINSSESLPKDMKGFGVKYCEDNFMFNAAKSPQFHDLYQALGDAFRAMQSIKKHYQTKQQQLSSPSSGASGSSAQSSLQR